MLGEFVISQMVSFYFAIQLLVECDIINLQRTDPGLFEIIIDPTKGLQAESTNLSNGEIVSGNDD